MNDVIHLNGLWDFVVDLDPKYHEHTRYPHPNWPRRNWQKVAVPGVWNKYAERYDIFEGVGWFARTFDVADIAEDTIFLLRFGAVNYLCDVFVNGEMVGSHEGGYTEFSFDVSHQIHAGSNTVAVRVDNRSLNMKLPPVLGYFNYGGIHRDVNLESYPRSYIADLSYVAEPMADNNSGSLILSGQVVTVSTLPTSIHISCCGVEERCSVDVDGHFQCSTTMSNVEPWSPEHPNLYPLEITLSDEKGICHRQQHDIGFRTIQVAGNTIELNGQAIDFRGICYLYDSPTYGLVMHPDQYEQDLGLFRELGVNAIRSHFAFPHDFLAACDRSGVMVWIEPQVYCIDPKLESCRLAFSDPSWRELALTMLEEGIQQSKLHPSVCIYGIGNECDVNADGAQEFLSALAARAREIDPSRLISYACLYGLAGQIADVVDVVGFNEYWGWYDVLVQEDPNLRLSDTGAPPAQTETRQVDLRKLDKLLSEQATTYRRPIFLTEFGADSIPGFLSESLELWSENYHAAVLRETFAIVDRMPFVCGTFPFVFADYRDPSKEINGYWDELNYKGVVDYARRTKEAFFALRDEYRRRAQFVDFTNREDT